MSRSFVSLTPGMQGGSPCLNNTRMTVDAAVSTWWYYGDMDKVRLAYPELTVEDVLVACWYAGRHGRKRWRRRLGEWAAQYYGSATLRPPWRGPP